LVICNSPQRSRSTLRRIYEEQYIKIILFYPVRKKVRHLWRSEKIIEGKRCPLIIVPRKVVHAFKNISNEKMYLLCYTDKPLIDERDVIKKVILK